MADGQLVTGQNPASSKRVAELVAAAVAPGLRAPVHGKGPGEGFHHRCAACQRRVARLASSQPPSAAQAAVPCCTAHLPPAAHSTAHLSLLCSALRCVFVRQGMRARMPNNRTAHPSEVAPLPLRLRSCVLNSRNH